MEHAVAARSDQSSSPSSAGENARSRDLNAEPEGLSHIRAALAARYPSETDEEPETKGFPWRGVGIAGAGLALVLLLAVIGLALLLARPPAPSPLAVTSPALAPPMALPEASPLPERRTASPPPAVKSSGALDPARPATTPAIATKAQPVPPEVRRPLPARPVSWTRVAAFADRRPAARLADTLRKQGYRTDVRREGSTPRPWVVWTSKGSAPR